MAVATLIRRDFSGLHGWQQDATAQAFAAFRLSCSRILLAPPSVKQLQINPPVFAAKAALALPAQLDDESARAFFEQHFLPYDIHPTSESDAGFVTAYYEPEIDGSLQPTPDFPVPIYRRPVDLVELKGEILADLTASGWPADLTWGRRLPSAVIIEHPDRRTIREGALKGLGLELVYVRSRTEAFFVHIQGSARIRLTSGGVMRIAFSGKSGHPYTPIGRILIEQGAIPREEMTADRLRHWLESHPAEADAMMEHNRSFIFFDVIDQPDQSLGPIAAAQVALTPGRSLAVDRHLHTFHLPIFVTSALPDPDVIGQSFQRLMIAQDTGSAILGPARGDIFFGSGESGWQKAAKVRHSAQFTLLLGKAEHPP